VGKSVPFLILFLKFKLITTNPQLEILRYSELFDFVCFVLSARPFVISTAGRNLTSSTQGDFSHPFEMTALFLRWQ